MQPIGVIGASGDLGSQLTVRIQKHGLTVRTYSRTDSRATLEEVANSCAVIHICAPVEALKNLPKTDAIIVLHDSVMSTSQQANKQYVSGYGAIVHMLMNDTNTVVIATDAPHCEEITKHFTSIGLVPKRMTTAEHDDMMARSQAPLALLCKTLLPYLYEQADKGLLTPSGKLLAETLRSRELTWTDATVHSILQNPAIDTLLHGLQTALIRERNKNL